MHGAGFHKYNKQRKYLPLWLRAENVYSICALAFQLKLDYAVKQLTIYPVTEEDIRFTWVQISGGEPLEFSDYHAAEPYVVLNPNVTEDMHFKVYIDKGESTELVSDMWIYRTPTEYTVQFVEDASAGTPQNLRVKTEDLNSIPSNIQSLFPEQILVTENTKNGYVLTQEDIISFRVYGVRKEPASTDIGMEVHSFEIYEAESGALVGRNTDGTLIANIPTFVSTFYIKIQISVYNGVSSNPRKYTLTSSQVYRTPLRKFDLDEKVVRLYAQEQGYNTLSNNLIRTYGKLAVNIDLPAILQYSENSTNISYLSGNVGNVVTKKALVKLFQEVSEDATPFNALTVLNVELKVNRKVIRYNGITIGG